MDKINNKMNATSIVNLCPTTKQQAATFADKMVGEVMEGTTNALEVHIKLTAMEQAIKDIKERTNEAVMDEAYKYGAKRFHAFDSDVVIGESGTKYDYSVCGDPVYNEAAEQEKKWAEKRKEREAFLKTIKGSIDMIIEGEALTINQPIKSSKTGVKITLK